MESAVRTCREGGGGVATNRMIRDLDLAIPSAGDSRRIEVIVDGLSLFGGAQLAVDATMVSPVRADGLPREGAATRDGVALTAARHRKQTYPELSGHQHKCCPGHSSWWTVSGNPRLFACPSRGPRKV